MMFSSKTVLQSFKSMDVAGAPPDLSRCQYLEYGARQLGFQTWNHLRSYLEKPAEDRVGKVHTGLMRQICGLRLPSLDSAYVRMTSYDDLSIGFESYYIGWDKKGNEVRVPRPNYDKQAVATFRSRYDHPLYVIETDSELLAWRFKWRSDAVLPEKLARAHFPSLFEKQHLVAENPPLDLVKRRIRREFKSRGLA